MKNQLNNSNSLILLIFRHVMAQNGTKKPQSEDWGFNSLVPRRGLEPPHPKAHGPEPCASTNSAIWALRYEWTFSHVGHIFNVLCEHHS